MHLIYCDESCHLEHDKSPVMILGAITCSEVEKRNIFNQIREIKVKHGLSPYFEIKWTKVSKGKEDFYIELINYLFDNDNLSFRAVIAHKNGLDNDKYNDGDYNLWYYKMYYYLIRNMVPAPQQYRIFVDVKDTNGGPRVRALHDALCNKIKDYEKKRISKINQIHSHESEIMQITDLVIGALGYFNRGYYKQHGNAKSKIVEQLSIRSGYSLNITTPVRENKFNLFVWEPRGGE